MNNCPDNNGVKEENSTDELHRRIKITTIARFKASQRLKLHSVFSQWTLSMLAVGQINISLMSSLDFPKHIDKFYFDFSSIFFGILVLAYSLLLGMGNFSERSTKIYNSGLELSKLGKKIFITNEKNKKEFLWEIAKEYTDIMSRYENHSDLDYLNATCKHYNSENELKKTICNYIDTENELKKILCTHYKDNLHCKCFLYVCQYIIGYLKIKYTLISRKLTSCVYSIIEFSHYIITVVSIWAWIIELIIKGLDEIPF